MYVCVFHLLHKEDFNTARNQLAVLKISENQQKDCCKQGCSAKVISVNIASRQLNKNVYFPLFSVVTKWDQITLDTFYNIVIGFL